MLHVARDKRHPARHDLGSVLCLNVLELLPPETVQVREWDDPRAPRPAWLTGTPTLVTPKDEVFRGHQALAYLQRLAVDMAKATTQPRPSKARPSPPSAANPQQREAAPPSVSSPPTGDDDPEDGGVGSLWETRIVDDATEEDEPTRKITGDDLARAMRARER